VHVADSVPETSRIRACPVIPGLFSEPCVNGVDDDQAAVGCRQLCTKLERQLNVTFTHFTYDSWIVQVIDQSSMPMAAVLDQASSHVYVLPLQGPLRVPIRGDLAAQVQALLAAGQRNVVLDMTDVPSIDAGGIGELTRAYTLALAVNGSLRVASTSRRVREVLQRVGLFELLTRTP
jgi:anti-sigma B factor antagonist